MTSPSTARRVIFRPPLSFLFVPFRRYADFNGRSTRTEYWLWLLFYYLAVLVAGMIGLALDYVTTLEGVFSGIISVIVVLGSVIPSLAIVVRRLHDAGYSGLLLLVGLIPLVGIVLFVFLLLPGTPGVNKYGVNPREYPQQY